MKNIVISLIVNYVVLGVAHALFATVLKKGPTLNFIVFEFLFWPRRTWRGLKAIARDAGKLDL